ncbi:MAG TPA: hypothetical protein VH061_04315 [Solirubrobacteraceae bacterium]|nr:hypothetical protein [Solirubrobacteraceae bacterium]
MLAVDASAGTVSRFHADGTPADFSALGSNVIDGVGPGDETPQGGLGFASGTGAPFETQVAVDSSGGVSNGDIYVAQGERGGDVVDIFSDTGEYLGQLTGLGLEPCGVAVDGSGHLFVGTFDGVHKFEPLSNPVTALEESPSFETKTVTEPCTISAGAGPTDGSLFVSTWKGPITKINSETGVVDYQIIEGKQNPNSAVDPASGRLLVASGPVVKEFDVSGSQPELLHTISEPSEVEAVAAGGPSDHVYVAASAGGAETRTGATELVEYGPLTASAPPIIEPEVVDATSEEAAVRAQINPESLASTVQVEYGPTEAYGDTSAQVAIGNGEAFRTVQVTLTGLHPGLQYHYRFVATNEVGTSRGSDQTLNTYRASGGPGSCPNAALRTGPAARLPDCRAYEMVTPVEKNNADIEGLINVNGDQDELDQSSTNGERLTYTTSQGFGDTKGVPYVSQYLATRTVAGWVNHSITPPQGFSKQNIAKRVELEYQDFTPDLCVGILQHFTDPALAPEAVTGEANLYRHDICGTEGYETLTKASLPSFPSPFPQAETQGLTADGRCSLFARDGGGLHETCAGHTVPVSISTAGVEVRGFAGTANGDEDGSEGKLRESSNQGAMSSDGSRVYWSEGVGPGRLMLRLNVQQPQSALGPHDECLEPAKACTVPVSREIAHTAYFFAASPDGERAIYADEGGAKGQPERPLYEFDAASNTSIFIANVLGGAEVGDPGAGVMGVNTAATRVYLVSKEELDGEGVAGQPNLFLYDSTKAVGHRFAFIGGLSPEDLLVSIDYGLAKARLDFHVARVSSDGLHAVFAAYAPLTGYDNRDAVTGQRDLEVFLYDAAGGGAGVLHCISCNPSGARPTGQAIKLENRPSQTRESAIVPTYATDFFGSRVISEDGDRVFFDSFESLVPEDTNGKEDVYEWEAPGSGDCSEASSAYSSLASGCVSLISTGESSSDSSFADASPDGRDVFFATQQSLAPQDEGLADIYDAREGGGFASPPPQPAPCNGDACQSPSPAPGGATPASATFNGPGNSPPEKPIVKTVAHPTRAQMLMKALKACKRVKKKEKRLACQRQARRRYGTHTPSKAGSKKPTSDKRRTGR